jgi:hypothetical protein
MFRYQLSYIAYYFYGIHAPKYMATYIISTKSITYIHTYIHTLCLKSNLQNYSKLSKTANILENTILHVLVNYIHEDVY